MLLGVAALLTSRSTFPIMCQVRTHIDAADRASNEAAADAYGESTAPYEASEISPSQIDHLISRGYVVLDGVFDAEEAAGLELCLQLLDDSDSLAAEPDGSGRDDSIRFVDESSAMLSIEAALHPLHPLCTLSAPSLHPMHPMGHLPSVPHALSATCAPPLHALCTPARPLRTRHARSTPQAAIRRLKGYGESLQVSFAATRAEDGADSAWSAPWSSAPSAAGGAAVERLEPREPATASRCFLAHHAQRPVRCTAWCTI